MKLKSIKALVLWVALFAVRALAEPTPTAFKDLLPVNNSRLLNLRVEQEAVPVTKSAGRINQLKVTVIKMGNCESKLTIKAYFIGKDVATAKVVVGSVAIQDGEAATGVGNHYTLKSKPFIITPATPAKGTAKAIPASGAAPIGWLVAIFQDGRVVSSHASSQGYETVVNTFEADATTAKMAAITEAETSLAAAEKAVVDAKAALATAKVAAGMPAAVQPPAPVEAPSTPATPPPLPATPAPAVKSEPPATPPAVTPAQ